MITQPLFSGLVFDEDDQLVQTSIIGCEPCYVVNDAGFLRHIPSNDVDRQILSYFKHQVEGHEDQITDQAAKMLGQDDLFSHAFIMNQLKQIDKQFDIILNSGIPEEGRAYMGMIGFRVIINVHGEVVRIDQPGITSSEEE